MFCQNKNLTTSTCELSPPRFFSKTKTLPQAPANYHHHGFCKDKNLTTSICELSPPPVLPRQKTLPQAPANYHHHGFCKNKNLTTSTCELSPPRVVPRQKPCHKHLRTITTTGFAKTKTLPQAPANYHRHGFCQDKNLATSTCELSQDKNLTTSTDFAKTKPYHKHLRTITTTGFAKTKTLPQAPANYHHQGFCQDKNLTTSTCALSPPRVLPRQKPYHKHLRTITTTGCAKTKNLIQARVLPRQKPYHKHLRTITTTGFAKTKTLPQAPANYHHHGVCQDKNLTISTCELSPPRVLQRQKPYHKHLRTIFTTGFAKTKTLPQAPANYHHHGFCQDKNLTTSTCELSPPRVLPRQKPYHKHLRTITTTGFAETKTLPQAPANYHRHGLCQDKNLTTSTGFAKTKTLPQALRTITATFFSKTKTLPQAPANYHHHGFCQDNNLTTSICELSPPRVLPRQKPYHKHLRTITTPDFAKTKTLPQAPANYHPKPGFAKTKTLPQAPANYHHHGFCQDKNLTTSTCELSPPRVLPRQKPYHKHLRTITTTGFAKTKTLPQAPANYHHHGFCQDKNLTTSTCELSPLRFFSKTKTLPQAQVLPRQKPYHKHLRTITATFFSKTKTLPQAPANYHHHGFCKDKNLTTSTCELSPPRVVPRQKPYHKHLRTITTTGCAKTKTLPAAPANYHHHGFCQDKNLTTSTCELSPPRVLPRQKPYHKHLRTITTTGFAKTKTLPQAPANYHRHGFCQDKNLTTSTCELSPPRVLQRQKPYHKHLRTITTTGFAKTKNLTTSTCELSPPRILQKQKPYHKHLRTIFTTGFAKTKTLPQAPANYHHHGFCKNKNLTTSTKNHHHHGFCQDKEPYHKHLRTITTTVFCQDKNLTTSTCELSSPRVLPRQKPYHKHLRTITTTGFAQKACHKHLRTVITTGFAKTKTLPQASANYHHHGFCQDKNLTTSTCELSPPRFLPRQKPYHKHLRTITATGFAKTKTLPQAPKNNHHHGLCQDKNLTTSICELSPPRVLPRQKPYHKHLRTITTPDFAKTKTLPQAPANYHPKPGFAKTKTLPQTPADYHHHGFCQDKNLTTSPCELSPPRVFAKTKTLPQAPANNHHHRFCPKSLPQAPANYHHHGFCQDKNLTTSTCELSPPGVLPRQKLYHKHLRTITTTGVAKTKTLPQAPANYHHHGFCQDKKLNTSTGFAKTKTLPQAPANYHHHGFCQDKNLTTSTCELSPPRVLQRQKPYHKHLRTITTTGFAKTKTLPQAPANYHHHGFCQDKNLTTSTCELSPPRALPRQKPYHKHRFCQDKNLTTSTCELSPPRFFPRQKPYHKHLRTITTAGFAKTRTLPQAPANYHHHGLCQDKNLTTSTCELSPPRVVPRQKPYQQHLRTITTTGFAKTKTLPQAPANYHHHGFCQDKNLTTSTCELSPPRILPRQKPYHKPLRTITATGFAKTKTLPQAPANYHHHGFCKDKNLSTSTCELSPPRVLPRQRTLPQAPANYHHHGFCKNKNLTTSTCELSPPRVLPRQKPYHKHLRTITTTGFAKTKTLPQAPANYHHHGFCQDQNLTTSTCELSPPWVLPRQKPYHKNL